MATPRSETSAPGRGESESAPAAPAAAPGGLSAWLPVLAAVVLSPALTWATVEFLLLPRLRDRIAVAAAGPDAAKAAAGAAGAADGREGGAGAPGSFEFQNMVVNLAGTMGTRYLKTSFLVTAARDADIKTAFEGAKPRLTDVTLNVLSSLTLADLEEPGAKNVIREKLVEAYNQALGRKVAEQVYFSDFVIQ